MTPTPPDPAASALAAPAALLRAAACALALIAAASPAFAIVRCELDGQPVDLGNGASTAGRSGLVRCRDADTGWPQREQTLKNGVFVGVERFYEKGELVRERSVDERGNGDGPSREWALVDGRRVLVHEDTQRNGSTVGLAKAWNRRGGRQRLTWYGDDGREEAYVEFNDDGQPSGLKCGASPVFGRDFDDRAACGFAGPATTVLYDGKGRPRTRIAFDHGQRRKTEQLDADGAVREVREIVATGVVESRFDANGTKRHAVRYTNLPPRPGVSPTASPPTVKTLEQEFAESGRLVLERRWTPADRGVELVEETSWYLNGQPKDESRIVDGPQGRLRREKTYFDSGGVASDGDWVVVSTRFDRTERPTGTHRTYAENGRVRTEQVYDDRGRLTRERAFDDAGAVVRDDAVYEDGSRKSVGR